MKTLTVVVLGSGGADWLSARAVQRIQAAGHLLLRTDRHPVTAWIKEQGLAYETLDRFYEQAGDFSAMNRTIADYLAELCEREEPCYCVEDAQSDTALQLLIERGISLNILPGISHGERCLALVQANEAPVCRVSAEAFAGCDYLPSQGILITEIHSRECAGTVKLKLCEWADEEMPVRLFQCREDTGELTALTIPLYEADRQKHYDHLTALFVPGLPYTCRSRFTMQDYLRIMEKLRAPEGCPWDRKQTHESLLPYLVEESDELTTAVRNGDIDNIAEELGDVLHQVGFHSVIAQQCGEFSFGDVTTSISAKMMKRHPYVFGDAQIGDAEEAYRLKEESKRKERGQENLSDAMRALSCEGNPLLRSAKVQKQAALVGFDFADAREAFGKIGEEAGEVEACFNSGSSPEAELGDLLYSVVNVCRLAGVDPTIALNGTVNRFIRRFSYIEEMAKNSEKSIKDLTLAEMNVYWNSAKGLEQ